MARITSSITGTRVVPFIRSEANDFRSRENGQVTQTGTALKSGQVLAKADQGAGTFALGAGATGNPTSSAVVVTGPAVDGVYNITFTAATKFQVEDPKGVKIGNGTLGVAFSAGGLAFTLSAGGTPAVAGDTATITVAEGTGAYVAYVADGSAGPGVALLYTALPAQTGTFPATIITEDAEVIRDLLTGLNTAAEKSLRAVGIKVRNTGFAAVATPTLD